MFSYYDRDMDNSVSTQELWETQVINKFDKLSTKCSLMDIMRYDDGSDDDALLSNEEFMRAFSKFKVI